MLRDNPYKGQTVKILTPEELQGEEGTVKGVYVPHHSRGYYDDPEPEPPLTSYSLDLELADGSVIDISAMDVIELDPRLKPLENLIIDATEIRKTIMKDKDKTYFLSSSFPQWRLKYYDSGIKEVKGEMKSITKKSPEFLQNAKKMVKAAISLRKQIRKHDEGGYGQTRIYLGNKIGTAIRAFDSAAKKCGYVDFGKDDREY